MMPPTILWFVIGLSTAMVYPSDEVPPGGGSAGMATTREFKRLRASAQSARDFELLAEYAERRAASCDEKASASEAELLRYTSGAAPHPLIPKYPPRERTLRELGVYYRQCASHWTELARFYRSQATGSTKSSGSARP